MRRFAVAAALSCLFLHLSPASAATLRVPKDHPTIQAAVDAADPNDVIEIKGTYTDPVVIDGLENLRLLGKGKAVLDGLDTHVPLTVNNSMGIVLERLRFVSGTPAGLLITNSTDVDVLKCRFQDIPTIGLDAQASVDVLVEGSKFQDIDGDALILNDVANAGPGTDDSRVYKNKFLRIGQDAIEVDGDGNVIEANKIVRAEADGIDFDGDDNLAIDNKLSKVGDPDPSVADGDGFEVDGDGNRVEGNKIVSPSADGVDVKGAGNEIVDNFIKRAGSDGIEIGSSDPNSPASGNLVEGNKVQKAFDNGVQMDSGGNTVRANTTKKSGAFGLRDTSLSATNVYQDNVFDSEQID